MTTTVKTHINADNKSYYARQFADKLISSMDYREIVDTAKEYFYKDKIKEPIAILEEEIIKSYPEILQYPHLEKETHDA